MALDRVRTAAEMELMTPDERARLIVDCSVASLDDLDQDFQERVNAKSRRIAKKRGLLDSDHS